MTRTRITRLLGIKLSATALALALAAAWSTPARSDPAAIGYWDVLAKELDPGR